LRLTNRQDFSIADGVFRGRTRAASQSLRQLPQCTKKRPNLKPRCLVNHSPSMSSGQVEQVVEKHSNGGEVFPDGEELIFANRIVNEFIAEFCFAGTPVLVNDAARGRKHAFPTTLPGLEREVGVFDIEGLKERIETTNRQVFVAVDRAGASTGPKNRY